MQQDIKIRLDKFLANAGIISRRGVKSFLKNNDVTIDGKRVTESGIRVGSKQLVLINGEKVQKPGFVYYILNKPIGIISSTADEFARDTVTSLIDTPYRIYPVGRLDKDSHGLVLLTNDGELTHQLIHPRYHVPKLYRILVAGQPTKGQLEQLRIGVILEDGITMPAEVTVVKTVIPNSQRVIPHLMRDPGSKTKIDHLDSRLRGNDKEKTTLDITLHEGRNRQIRRMCEEMGIQLLDLQRIAFGPLKLGSLKRGEYRELSKKEVESLRKVVE